MSAGPRSSRWRRVAPAIALFLLAPTVGELLLGNLSVTQLPFFLPLLAPMYGGGALLIREVARRTGRGPTTMLILGVAYGLVEEGLVDQMLFNRHYAGNDGMGDTHIPVLGMGGWLTIGVLTMHAVWSTNVGITLVEALVPARAQTPWLGRTGLAVTAVVFVTGSGLVAWGAYHDERFVAAPAQLIGTTVVAVALIAAAFRRKPASRLAGTAPRSWVVGVVAFPLASAFPFTADLPGWWSATAAAVLIVVAIVVIGRWSRQRGWDPGHRLALACAAVLTYAWMGFGMRPESGPKTVGDHVLNVVLALGAVALVVLTTRRRRGFRPVGHLDEGVR